MTLDLQASWASLLLKTFADAGVRELILSPGSRSTPFVLAATRERRLHITDAIDERTAAFFALGQAKATGKPSLLLCTSGSAAAHYFPAVIEAAYAHVPLLILTADRPFELQNCGAAQTIDQTRLFGAHARSFVELGSADGSELSLRALRREVAQAVSMARFPLPGPVHLNARARKPLEPHPAEGDVERAAAKAAEHVGQMPLPKLHEPRSGPSAEGVSALAEALRRAKRALFFCGPMPLAGGDAGSGRAVSPVLELAARAGFPLLAEASSQLRFVGKGKRPAGLVLCDSFGVFLTTPRMLAPENIPENAPDLILQIGGTPTSSAWERYLGTHASTERWLLAPHGWNDPLSSAAGAILGEPAEIAAALLQADLGEATATERLQWRELFATANHTAWEATDAVLATAGFSEPAAVRAIVGSIPEGAVLAVGNSLPIREVDAFCRSETAVCPVWSQRGANGIDGLISGAAGVAATGREVTLLLGDVSLLHDIGGLALARQAEAGGGRLTIVVLHNGGGRIFEELPIASAPEFARQAEHFTTPHKLDFAPAAALYRLTYRRADSLATLAAALEPATPRPLLVEVALPPRSTLEVQRAIGVRFAAESHR